MSVLHRKGSLDAAFGSRRIGTDALDVEFIQRTRKLRVASAGGYRRSVDAKSTGLIAVERQRLAMVVNQYWDRGILTVC